MSSFITTSIKTESGRGCKGNRGRHFTMMAKALESEPVEGTTNHVEEKLVESNQVNIEIAIENRNSKIFEKAKDENPVFQEEGCYANTRPDSIKMVTKNVEGVQQIEVEKEKKKIQTTREINQEIHADRQTMGGEASSRDNVTPFNQYQNGFLRVDKMDSKGGFVSSTQLQKDIIDFKQRHLLRQSKKISLFGQKIEIEKLRRTEDPQNIPQQVENRYSFSPPSGRSILTPTPRIKLDAWRRYSIEKDVLDTDQQLLEKQSDKVPWHAYKKLLNINEVLKNTINEIKKKQSEESESKHFELVKMNEYLIGLVEQLSSGHENVDHSANIRFDTALQTKYKEVEAQCTHLQDENIQLKRSLQSAEDDRRQLRNILAALIDSCQRKREAVINAADLPAPPLSIQRGLQHMQVSPRTIEESLNPFIRERRSPRFKDISNPVKHDGPGTSSSGTELNIGSKAVNRTSLDDDKSIDRPNWIDQVDPRFMKNQ